MRIRVRFYGPAQTSVGARRKELDVPDGKTLGELLEDMIQFWPDLENHTSTLVVSLNRREAAPGALLREDDELILLPPVAGGSGPLAAQKTY